MDVLCANLVTFHTYESPFWTLMGKRSFLPFLCFVFHERAIGYFVTTVILWPYDSTSAPLTGKSPFGPHTFCLALMDIQSVAVHCFGIHRLSLGDTAVIRGLSQGPFDVKHGYWWAFWSFSRDQTRDLLVIGWSLEPNGSSQLPSQ